MTCTARALHYVFRVADRRNSLKFYTQTLGMKVLRHEEFREPCKANCNGPFDGMWSKTMVGFGNEDEHFVLELTYNYGVHSYELGNDFHGIHIESDDVLARAEGMGEKTADGALLIRDPDGHSFFVKGGTSARPLTKVSLKVADLHESHEFWSQMLGMEVLEGPDGDKDKCLFTYGPNQCSLELISLKSGQLLDRKSAFGRIAFATATTNLKTLEDKVGTRHIHSSLVSLDTPGKATVWVVILRDPNEHEICFVGDEGFRDLSRIDAEAEKLLMSAVEKDDS
uniref:Glyoxalase domain-containing protein 4 n=1 Tax=Globodera pallida TaxID=36090 RepID=A0A183BZ39_GLOPA